MVRKTGVYSSNRLRYLKQYKDLDDDEFDEIMEKREQGMAHSADYEKRIQQKMVEFERDYDVSGQKVNDRLTLRALIQAYITLEDLEHFQYNIRIDGINLDEIIELEKLNSLMSSLRNDISKMQTDLGISRKARKGDREETVLSDLERLKTKAKEFYETRMMYVFCPKCNTLLSTTWFLYPEAKYNKIQLECNQKDKNGDVCGERFTISSKEMLEKRGFNSDDVPEALK